MKDLGSNKKEEKEELRRRISQYISEELNHNEVEQLWKDLLDHPELLKELKAQATIKSIYRESEEKAVKPAAPKGLYTNYMKPYAGWALALAAILLIVVGLNLFNDRSQTSGSEPLASISLEHLESSDVLRSDGETLSGFDSLMHSGYSAAVNNNTQLAISYFEEAENLELDEDHPAGVAKMNLGIIYYNDRNFEHAASLFSDAMESATSSSTFEKSRWFLANTYAQLGELEQARKVAAEVYESGGAFSDDAYNLMESLGAEAGFTYQ